MSRIGFYRYKLDNATSQDVTLYVNGVVSKVKKVVAKEVCTGYKLLKFLDRNGQYRFYPFAAEHGIKDTPKQIGEVNEIITSLLTSQSDKKNVGYTNDRTMTLRAAGVSASELEILSDIYTSPRVFLFVGTGSTDDMKDWVQVTAKGDNINKREKRNFGRVEITITLPKHNVITML